MEAETTHFAGLTECPEATLPSPAGQEEAGAGLRRAKEKHDFWAEIGYSDCTELRDVAVEATSLRV